MPQKMWCQSNIANGQLKMSFKRKETAKKKLIFWKIEMKQNREKKLANFNEKYCALKALWTSRKIFVWPFCNKFNTEPKLSFATLAMQNSLRYKVAIEKKQKSKQISERLLKKVTSTALKWKSIIEPQYRWQQNLS